MKVGRAVRVREDGGSQEERRAGESLFVSAFQAHPWELGGRHSTGVLAVWGGVGAIIIATDGKKLKF